MFFQLFPQHVVYHQLSAMSRVRLPTSSSSQPEDIPIFGNPCLQFDNDESHLRSKLSALGDPSLRYLHRFLTYMIFGRGDSQGVISKVELFVSWCMMYVKHFNVGIWLSIHLRDVAKARASKIENGAIVTQIIEHLGLLIERTVMQLVSGNSSLDLQSLVSMKIVRR
ncbi:hypothetical protein K2173_004013 [Erythroxylum novogranatense]|uniref:Uncharacterized protein n=1 Tax=Erythroxylum novogranatense TaxID=1862640 RepID=A0AAV8SJE0_9ROSI|nr:hypothetical protein K2173_004013 [Erythroxylum novogranatense]